MIICDDTCCKIKRIFAILISKCFTSYCTWFSALRVFTPSKKIKMLNSTQKAFALCSKKIQWLNPYLTLKITSVFKIYLVLKNYSSILNDKIIKDFEKSILPIPSKIITKIIKNRVETVCKTHLIFVFFIKTMILQNTGNFLKIITKHFLESLMVEGLTLYCIIPANIYLLKFNNRSTRKRCGICSKLTIKTPERRFDDPLFL